MSAARRSRPDILAQLAAYHREKQLAPMRDAQKALARALDDLNAMGVLEEMRVKRFSANLCGGPAARDGLMPEPWVGALIWHRPAGYFGYKTLTLLGIWAIQRENVPLIMLGVRRLAFAAPFYDAEAYVKLIRGAFDLYYDDKGNPPPTPALTFAYDAAKRLEQREVVAKTLQKLATEHTENTEEQ